MTKKVKKLLPEKAGKKSGKRGIGPPLDPTEDFDKPVTKQTPMSVGPLAADNPPTPAVMNGRMKVFYDKPYFTKYKDRVLIALQFTVPLEKAHNELLPKTVADAHHDLLKKGRIKSYLNGIPAQHAMLFLSSDQDEDIATMPACKMTGVNISIVQRKGEGSARKVARLAFRLQSERSEPLAHFAEMNIGNDFWLQMRESQESLWDDDED